LIADMHTGRTQCRLIRSRMCSIVSSTLYVDSLYKPWEASDCPASRWIVPVLL